MYRPEVTIAGSTHYLFDVAGFVGIVGLAVTLITSVVRNTQTLYRAEPLRG